MRILIESPSCNALEGSNAAVGHGWVRALAVHHEVHLVTYATTYDRGHPGGRAADIPNVHPIRIAPTALARLGSLSDFMISARLRRRSILEEVRPDLVHSLEPAGWTGPRALATDRFPYVVGPLNGGSVMPPRAFADAVLEALPVKPVQTLTKQGPRKLATSLFNEMLFGPTPSARALAHSAMTKARRIVLATSLGPGGLPSRLEGRSVHVIPQGIDLDLFRAEPKPNGRRLSLIYTGRIIPWKALHLVIEALAKADAELSVYGGAAPQDAWYLDHCRSRANALGLEDRITWHGMVPRGSLAQAYSRADAFCMLSLWEPYATTWIESFACGTPVISLAAGGAHEAVTTGVGWLVAPTTPQQVIDDLAELIQMLASNRKVVAEAGRRARALAEERYSWTKLADRMTEVYEEAIDEWNR